MDESEQLAKTILEKEGHTLEKCSPFQSPDFKCYNHCDKYFEIKSIGKNNIKIGFKMGQLESFKLKDVTVLVIDRRTRKEIVRFKVVV